MDKNIKRIDISIVFHYDKETLLGETKIQKPKSLDELEIDSLFFARVSNRLAALNIHTIEELIKTPKAKLYEHKYFGGGAMNALTEAVYKAGLDWK